MSISELETTIVVASNALVGSTFGAHLRAVHPGRRMVGASRIRWLAAFENSLAPAVRRTLAILESARLTGRDLELDAADHEYIEWVRATHAFLRSAVDRFWHGIAPDLRVAFVDHDDLPPLPFTSTYIPDLRVTRPPDLHASSRPIGITEAELSSLSRVWHAARQTPAFDEALTQASRVRRERGIRTSMLRLKAAVVAEGRNARGPTFDAEQERLRRLGDSAYASASDEIQTIANALRAYNELVQRCLALLLGAAERDQMTRPLQVSNEPISAELDGRDFQVRMTTRSADPGELEFAAPFLIDDGGPVDGVYWVTSWSIQMLGGTMVFDVEGLRTRELEGGSSS